MPTHSHFQFRDLWITCSGMEAWTSCTVGSTQPSALQELVKQLCAMVFQCSALKVVIKNILQYGTQLCLCTSQYICFSVLLQPTPPSSLSPRRGSASSSSSSGSSSSSDSDSSDDVPIPPDSRDTTFQNPFASEFSVSCTVDCALNACMNTTGSHSCSDYSKPHIVHHHACDEIF